MQLERLIEKREQKVNYVDEVPDVVHIKMEIRAALDRLRNLNVEEKENKEERSIIQEEKKIDEQTETVKNKEEITSVTYSILDDIYSVQFQASFYSQSTDYSTLYAHMGNASHTMQSPESSKKMESPQKTKQHKGEMRNEEARKTVQRVIYLKMFGTDDMSVEEKEQFANWRHFNKPLRRLYEATASVRYKQIHLKAMPMKS